MAQQPDYTEVRHLIFRGFLTEPVSISGVPVQLKTLTPSELEMVELYAYSDDSGDYARYHTAYFVAYSIFLFNRQLVLSDRESFLNAIVPQILTWPELRLRQMLGRLQKLNSRAFDVLSEVEAFSFGVESRQQWALYKAIPPNAPSATGIAGTDYIGLNYHQKLWYHFNTEEDNEDSWDQAWTCAKFMASVHSKDIKKIDSKDSQAKKDLFAKRKALYDSKGTSTVDTSKPGEIRVEQNSVQELLDEMHKSLSGQKDFHDQVVEEYTNRMAQKARAERQARFERAQARKPILSTEEEVSVYSEAELDALLEERKHQKWQLLQNGAYEDAEAFDDQINRMNRYRMLDNPQDTSENHPINSTVLGDYYQVSSSVPDPSDTE